jgi:16S rRNA (adenine1518-N6/adenine1519-N6)-dimethyltransferase
VAATAKSRHRSADRPTKKPKLGQNFLVDIGAAQRIVDALGDISRCTVVEIGPGRGAITGLLASKAEKLIAVELDRTLAAQLRMAYLRKPHVEILEADILHIDCDSLVQGRSKQITTAPQEMPHKVARVVGNLPYYITSDILLKLFECHKNFDRIVIMVQKEVADRIAAESGTSDYGVLSATAQLFADVENLFTLPPEAFSPPPKVHSSVLRLRIAPKAAVLGVDEKGFIAFLRSLFAQKRKTLSNNLKPHFESAQITSAIRTTGLKADVRAEAVPLEQMAALYKSLYKK